MAEITENVVAKMVEMAPLNLEKAEAIAAEFGLKSRAVIASAVRRGIQYDKKQRVNKAGEKVTSKTDLVAAIASKYDLNPSDLEGLEKASKSALQVLAG